MRRRQADVAAPHHRLKDLWASGARQGGDEGGRVGVEMDGSMESGTAEFTLRQEKLKVGSSEEEGLARRWCAQGSQPSSLCPTF
jgi:hypothetical protein